MLMEGSGMAREGLQRAGDADWSLELKGNKTGGGKKQGGLEDRPFRSPGARWKTQVFTWPGAPGKTSKRFR